MDQNKYAIPKYGLFTPGSIVGVLVDMDRGAINFFKDGQDLGPAFVAPHIKEGNMYPFIHTQIQCKLSIFHPSVYPWFEDKPIEPTPPEHPTIETITDLELSGMTPHLARSSEGTDGALH